MIGFAFAVNTAVIVLLQFTVLNRIKGRRRTRVMIVMAGVWAASWLILGAAGLLPDSLTAAICVLAFMGVFAFGETLLQPTVPAIYNDLASDHNRGRYNAINSAAFQGGAITGPIAAGLLLGNGLDAVYIAVMVVGCVGIGVLALALERRLPASANGVTASDVAAPEPTSADPAAPRGLGPLRHRRHDDVARHAPVVLMTRLVEQVSPEQGAERVAVRDVEDRVRADEHVQVERVDVRRGTCRPRPRAAAPLPASSPPWS